jgi:hypothetical protein
VHVSLFLKQGRGRLEIILFGLAGLKFSFLRGDGTELTVFAFEPTTRFE